MSDIRSAATGRPRARMAVVAVAAISSWLVLGVASALAAPMSAAAAKATAHSAHVATAGTTSAAAAHAKSHGSHGRATGHAKAHAAGVAAGHATAGTAGTAGDPTTPQPPSRADGNSGGANGQCPGGIYCSTRDGSPSGNGNGGGKATGKPCAGCVGKADNKNPPGQEKTDPYNTFPNNGYECDRNHGIGRTNPAHTGCTVATPPPCPAGEVMNSETGECAPPPCDATTENCGPPPPCDATTENCGPPPPPACVPTKANNFCSTVQGEHHSRTPGAKKPTTQVLGEKVVRTPGALPFTGAAGLGLLISTGATALGLGAALTAAARRRRARGDVIG